MPPKEEGRILHQNAARSGLERQKHPAVGGGFFETSGRPTVPGLVTTSATIFLPLTLSYGRQLLLRGLLSGGGQNPSSKQKRRVSCSIHSRIPDRPKLLTSVGFPPSCFSKTIAIPA
jgi:hypothetical protein